VQANTRTALQPTTDGGTAFEEVAPTAWRGVVRGTWHVVWVGKFAGVVVIRRSCSLANHQSSGGEFAAPPVHTPSSHS